MSMQELLKAAVRLGASDVHLSTGLVPMVRIDGDVVPLDGWTDGPLPAEMTTALLRSILDDRQRSELDKHAEYDFSATVADVGRFRGNAYRQNRGPGVALRLIPTEVRTPQDLGAPPALAEMMKRRHGLVLVTGPTGSGKSTTAASLIDLVNRSHTGHVVSIEDPIEFVHAPQKCVVTQREVGLDTASFPDALRAALREDPDVIFIGEMRDLATIALAVTAAETGHLVVATLHTAGAAKSIDRIINVFPAAEQAFIRTLLAGCLLGVASQALLKRKDQRGRIAVFEMMVATSGVRNMIRQGKIHQLASVIQTGVNDGMCTFRRSLAPLVAEGRVDAAEANEMLSQFEDDEGGDMEVPTAGAVAAAQAVAAKSAAADLAAV